MNMLLFMNVWAWFRSEDKQGIDTLSYISRKWEAVWLFLLNWKKDLYLGLLFCGTHYTFVLFLLCNILQYAIVIFLYVMILLLCVWFGGRQLTVDPLNKFPWESTDTHTHTQCGPLQKCNLGLALFPPNTEMQSKWQRWQMVPISKWKGSKTKFNEGRF